MCRLLMVQDPNNDAMLVRTQSYVRFLNLSMELERALDWPSAMSQLSNGEHFDILMLPNCSDSPVLLESARRVQPWLKCMRLENSLNDVSRHTAAELCVPEAFGIDHFYRAVSILSPETADTARLPHQQEEPAAPSVFDRILSVLRIIETEYQDDIGLEYIAQRIYISPCYLSTLFSRFMGVSLLSYLNDFRMNKAVELLTNSDTKVTDICQSVGYRNLPYFCTVFKTKYGITPAQYRKQYSQFPSAC